MNQGYLIAPLRRLGSWAVGLWVILLAAGCGGTAPWNSPYPAKELRGNVMFAAFDVRPKHLDPARSYSANEYRFISQIYEPPLQYQYLKRPYTLIPATVEALPRAELFDDKGKRLPDDVPPQSVAYTVYEIHVHPGIRYQPHPAFAVDADGKPLYQHLTADDLKDVSTLFANGRGIPAQGPIPPGIFGYREGKAGMNPYIYDWINGAPQRKPLAVARRLLAKAGYPGGVDAKTSAPLLLHFDITATGPDDKARLDWYLKQFQRINIQLDIRNTDYNRFQDKVQKGTAQIYLYGWNADYPDPENFLFLLRIQRQGEISG
jgi:hypothetical protein